MTNDNAAAVHYVCTFDEGKSLLAGQTEFYLRPCGCRTSNSRQPHADNNYCLWFTAEYQEGWGEPKTITTADAEQHLERARREGLVIRPFRDFGNRSDVIGICFCCACCCNYFSKSPHEACDLGAYIEQTESDLCNDCGHCEPACLFHARTLPDGALQVDHDRCYGCGNCTDVCPTDAIRMVGRIVL